MQKNLIFRAAIFTLILVVGTVSFMGGTLAKYTWTSGPITDSVRVAKFEFTVNDQNSTNFVAEGNQIDIFGDEDSPGKKELYPEDTGSFDIYVVNTSEVTVEAQIDARMVGTNGEEYVPNILFNLDGSEAYLPLSEALDQLNQSDALKDIAFPSPGGSVTKSATIYWKWVPGGNDDFLPAEMVLRMEVDATISQVD